MAPQYKVFLNDPEHDDPNPSYPTGAMAIYALLLTMNPIVMEP
jgi:hypothetical protein